MPVVLVLAPELAGLLWEIQSVRAELEKLKKVHSESAIRTINEIDELFAKVDHIREIRKPGKLTERWLKKLDYLPTSRSNEAMTFSEIGKILGPGRRDEKTNIPRRP